MNVSDNTIVAKGLADFFKNASKKRLNVSKKWQNFFKSPGKALEIGAKVGTAFASRSLNTA